MQNIIQRGKVGHLIISLLYYIQGTSVSWYRVLENMRAHTYINTCENNLRSPAAIISELKIGPLLRPHKSGIIYSASRISSLTDNLCLWVPTFHLQPRRRSPGGKLALRKIASSSNETVGMQLAASTWKKSLPELFRRLVYRRVGTEACTWEWGHLNVI